jgi:nucleolar protein TMA23
MDAQAYLIRHGWSGPGNPLNPNRRPGTHGGLGLTKPILIARRKGNLGVGKVTTKDPTNQWWLRGFEDALKDVGNENKTGSESKPNALTSELYRHFVRGEVVPGTLGSVEKKDKAKEKGQGSDFSSKKRKKDDGDGVEDREAKKLRKEERKRKKMGWGEDGEESAVLRSGSKDRKESKEERRQRKEESRRRKEEKEMKKKEKEMKKKEKEMKKARKAEETEDSTATDGNEKPSSRKDKKDKKRHSVEEDYPTPISIDNDMTESSGREESSGSIEKSKKKKEKKDKKEKEKGKESKKRKKTEESTSDEGSRSKSKKSKDAQKSSKD